MNVIITGGNGFAGSRLVRSLAEAGHSGTYEIANRERPSLAEVIAAVRRGLSLPPGMWPFPRSFLVGALRLAGQRTLAESLFGDLTLDAAPFAEAFSWRPARPTLEAMEISSGREP